MVPSALLEDSIRTLLAADATNLAAPIALLGVQLVASPFVPSRGLVFSGLTLASFAGSTLLNPDGGVQQSFFNPIDGENIVQLKEPLGGWHWQASAPPATPETIFGYVVTRNDGTTILGSDIFDPPVVITNTGDAVDIPEIRLSIPLGVIT